MTVKIHDLVVLLILVLATARATQLVANDKIFAPVRSWLLKHNGEDGWFTYLVHCWDCASFWAGMGWALFACLLLGVQWWFLLPLGFALSYLTILLNDLRGS